MPGVHPEPLPGRPVAATAAHSPAMDEREGLVTAAGRGSAPAIPASTTPPACPSPACEAVTAASSAGLPAPPWASAEPVLRLLRAGRSRHAPSASAAGGSSPRPAAAPSRPPDALHARTPGRVPTRPALPRPPLGGGWRGLTTTTGTSPSWTKRCRPRCAAGAGEADAGEADAGRSCRAARMRASVKSDPSFNDRVQAKGWGRVSA